MSNRRGLPSTDGMKDLVREVISRGPSKRESWRTTFRDIFWSLMPTARRAPRFDKLRTPTTIFISGLDVAGKSTLLYQLSCELGRPVDTHILFIGAHIEVLHCGHLCLLAADVGGARPLDYFRLEMAYHQVCDALVFVVDSTDSDRIIEAKEEFYRALGGFRGDSGLRSDVPVLVMANKQHVAGASRPEEVAKVLQIGPAYQTPSSGELWGDRPLRVAGTDVLSGQGVSEALNWLIDTVGGKKRKIDLSRPNEKTG